MKNFVISLSTEVKRREHITAEFQNQKIDFSFFDAVTPNTMEHVANEVGVDISKTELKNSEIGCLLSHVALWKKAVDNDIPYIAIFEDDIHLGKNAQDFLMNDEWIKDSFDVVKLETFYKEIVIKTDIQSITIHDRVLSVLGKKHLGCGGYILSKKAATQLLSKIRQYEKLIPVDHIVFNQLLNIDFETYQMIPGLCIQDHKLNESHQNFPSHLEYDRNMRKGEKIYKPKLNFVQKLRRELLRIVHKVIEFFTQSEKLEENQKLIHLKFK